MAAHVRTRLLTAALAAAHRLTSERGAWDEMAWKGIMVALAVVIGLVVYGLHGQITGWITGSVNHPWSVVPFSLDLFNSRGTLRDGFRMAS